MARENLGELLSILERFEQRDEDSGGVTDASETSDASDLIRALELLSIQYDFQSGDLVQWKPGLKNKRRPADGEPMIVVEVLDEPAMDTEKSSGSPYFREPLDLVGAIRDDDGDFMILHYDKRRFEPFNED